MTIDNKTHMYVAFRLVQNQDTSLIPPSLVMTKNKMTATQRRATEDLATTCNEWYRTATNLQPFALDKTTNREDRVNLRQFRLGYKTTEDIIHGLEATICEQCCNKEDQMVHYMLHCPQTYHFNAWIRP